MRMARLQKEAVDKNWLPQIGPVVTLDSLGMIAAQIVAEQALLDNGRRKAERAVAAADVEVAAVSLAIPARTPRVAAQARIAEIFSGLLTGLGLPVVGTVWPA